MLSNWIRLKNKELDPTFIDSYEYKRIKVVGDLMKEIFKVYFEQLINVVRENIIQITNKKYIKLTSLVNADILRYFQ